MGVKSLRRHRLLLVIILLYVILGSVIIYCQYRYITNYQYTSLGKNALNLAELAAKTLHISNADVKELEAMSFEHSQTHLINDQLKELFQLVEKNDSIKYAYILRQLPDNKVKYEVDEADTAFYDLPPGTKLDYIWLLDVIVDEKQQKKVAMTKDYYKDKNRYTTIDGELKKTLENKDLKYLLSEGEWGTEISGLAPIYTTEGEYIGLLGVDMYPESFYQYRATIFWALLTLIMIPTIFMSCMYMYLHLAYRRKMNALAYRDQLTKVYNRRYFDSEGGKIFEAAIKKQTQVGVVIGDIDDFKCFNDQYGHQEGDAALQSVAQVLEASLKGQAGFVARYGGEEFVLVLDDPEDMAGLCRNICTDLSENNIKHMDGSCTHVTISLGAFVKMPDSGERLEQYVKKADDAMYEAKKAGKNTFIMG